MLQSLMYFFSYYLQHGAYYKHMHATSFDNAKQKATELKHL